MVDGDVLTVTQVVMFNSTCLFLIHVEGISLSHYLKKKSRGLKFINYSTLRKTDVTFTCDPTHALVTHKSKSCFQTAAVAVTILTQ